MDSDTPRAQALAISDGKIVALGSDEEILAYQGSSTRVVDLDDRTVLPGFVDAHNHVFNDASRYGGGMTFEQAQELALSGGTTTMADMFINEHYLEEMQSFAQDGSLRIRTSLYLTYTDNCGKLTGDWFLDHPPVLDSPEMLRIPGVKMFLDGGTCGRPALSVELPEGGMGDLFLSEAELAEALERVNEAGYQAAIHAIGDRAVETALNAIETATDASSKNFRPRIEHNIFVRPEHFARYGELGVIPVVVGNHKVCRFIDAGGVVDIGEFAHTWHRPLRSLVDANPGLPIAWHSDVPYFADNLVRPISDLAWMVTRRGFRPDGTVCEPPDWYLAHAVTAEEALQFMTSNSAYALFMEDMVGSLAPGKFADIVVLSQDPLNIEPNLLIETEVHATMVGGRFEYCLIGQEFCS